ncbi:NAD-dependent protein deacetylase Sirt6 [Thrips palmi]|uniref:protein acetyllysine N-acetyltransferase n=1 Tax=Thrips palmi TaxID=161013 RepID=A0A6P8ZLS7_THRPL|nr:NAD-dependent protein deacetylase Sirt6 [Thrips palmi]
MSCNYADGLSPYHDKGKLGLAEKFDSNDEVKEKILQLASWISAAKHVVVHTGAGISTSAGIPDFRGPNGVWTLEAKGEKPNINISFNDAVPTKTHMALVALVKAGKVHFVVSQNIDGLHLRSNLKRANLAELHGNMFIEQCNQCNSQFIRNSATPTVGQKCLGTNCPSTRLNGRPCRGRLHDTLLDWEHNLPEKDLALSDFHSCVADLSICLGTTLQIVPSGNLPLHTKKHGECGRVVICNLQPTKHDKKADLIIRTYVDDVMVGVCKQLGISIPEYSISEDPTKQNGPPKSWTIPSEEVKRMRKVYEDTCCKGSKRTKDGKSKDQETKRRGNFKANKLRKVEKDGASSKSEIVPKEEIVNDDKEMKSEQQETKIKSEDQSDEEEQLPQQEDNDKSLKQKLKVEDIENLLKDKIDSSEADHIIAKKS